MWLKNNILSLLTIAVMFGISIVYYPDLPDTIPSHFTFSGIPDSYTDKAMAAFMLPVIFLFMLIIVKLLVRLSPSKFAMENSKRSLDNILFGTGILLLGFHLALILAPGPITPNQLATKLIASGSACFLLIVGNMFAKSERNFFVGIRLPWTIASEKNWKATHRLAGRLMVIAGLAVLGLLPLYCSIALTMSAILISVLLPCAYSLWFYLNNEKQQQ